MQTVYIYLLQCVISCHASLRLALKAIRRGSVVETLFMWMFMDVRNQLNVSTARLPNSGQLNVC